MRKLTVVMLAAHACIRVQKEALALIEKGHHVHLISLHPPSFADAYRSYVHCFNLEQFWEAIRIYSGVADIFHAHNEPSYFVTMVKEICDKPVVMDVHDSFLARITPEEEDKRMEQGKRRIRVSTEERNNFQLADALVFPGKSFAKVVLDEFRLLQPHLVLPSYLPRSLYCYDAKEWLGGLVYEGRVDVKEDTEKDDRNCVFKYTDYEEMAKKCKEVGIDFHLQVVRKDKEFMKVYGDIAYVHPPVGWDKLLRKISRHDWGLVGNIFPTREWELALPNKLFEYAAAGVPTVAINAKESAEFINEHGLGIAVESVEELADRWGEHRKWRAEVIRKRQSLCMEEHIGKLETLYTEVLG